jgi:rhodanese-related sulfurtransferase
MKRFSASELHTHLQNTLNPPLLLDVREPWEFDYCHINGSQLVPMRHVPEVLDELDPEQEIVVICHHGIRSRQIGIYLETQGFKNVINLEGGVEDWAQQVDPTMKRY